MNAEQIYDTLCKQNFRDFYEGMFVDHISDSQLGPSKEAVLAKIGQLFHVSDEGRTFFPVKIEVADSVGGRVMRQVLVCKTPQDIPSGKAIRVLETNTQSD